MSTLREVQNAALQLPARERWRLAESLLGSLPPDVAADPETLLAVATARDDEIEDGKVAALDEATFWTGVSRKA